MSTVSPHSEPKSSFSFFRVLLVAIPVLLIAVTWFTVKKLEFEKDIQSKEPVMMAQMGFKPAAPQRLDARFTDADRNRVADAPADPAQHISPDTLIFSFIGGPDAKAEKDHWKELADYLAQQTGKQVDVVTFATTDEQLAAMADGKLHVAGFNTGAVPQAVNTRGFVPVCVPGKDDGSFGYTMKFIVPTGSRVKKLQDLKDEKKTKKVTFTDLNSHSGYKAAVVELKRAGLLPDRDYQMGFSTAHDVSIKGVADGQFQAAPVASDLLQRAEAEGTIAADQYRVIYESERFPPATLGYVYNLDPELAEKIQAALFEFSWAGTGVEDAFGKTGATKFVPVNYKDDFAIIWRIDEALGEGPGLEAKN